MDSVQKLLGDNPTIWVFGYGSLLWKPDFRYKSKKIGFVKDFQRRFYQGNVTFRGKPGQPGRVANLIEKRGSKAWGVAYEISGKEEVTQVLQALYTRETASGGYITIVTTFYPRQEGNTKRMMPTLATNIPTNIPTNKPTKNGNEFSNSVLHETLQDLHKFQPSQQKFDTNISESSIKKTANDENIQYLSNSNEQHHGQMISNSEQVHPVPIHKDNLLYSLRNNKNVDNSLIHYFHDFNNKFGQESQTGNVNFENSDIESLSSSYDPDQGRRYNMEETKLGSMPVKVLLYTATSDNDLYLGPDDVTNMARQIVNANGSAGSNVEYVTKIAEYVKKYIPEDQDSHLFGLEAKVREEVYRQHVLASPMLHLSFADLSYDLHDLEHDVIAEPVMAS